LDKLTGPLAQRLVMRFSFIILLSQIYFLNHTLSGGMESLHSGMAEWWNGGMAEWLLKWRNGGMAGEMAGWQDGVIGIY
jgi:hypothetical protein